MFKQKFRVVVSLMWDHSSWIRVR